MAVKDNQVVVSSRQVAESFGKQHKDVLASIYKMQSAENFADCPELTTMFYENTYIDSRNRSQKEYLMDRDGFSLLVMGFTGKEALVWKLKYIRAFNKMEKKLKESNTPQRTDRELSLDERKLALEEKKFMYESWLKLGELTTIPEYKQITQSYAANTLAGKEVFSLPEANKKTYSATEIGNILGISANKVGRIAKQYGLKTKEYGKLFYDKARHSNKEIETFRYHETAVTILKEIIAKEETA